MNKVQLERRQAYLAEKNKSDTETAACRMCSRIFERPTLRKNGDALAENARKHHCSEECRQKARHCCALVNQSKADAYWNRVKLGREEYADLWRDRRRSAS